MGDKVKKPTRREFLGALGLALLLTRAGWGWGVASARTPQPSSAPSPEACVTGTAASYIGTSCSQGGTVYHWLSYNCTSTPASICDELGTNGSGFVMHMDPEGPFTILMGGTDALKVTAGQSLDLVIRATVYGALRNSNWAHYHRMRWQKGWVRGKYFGQPGQTGDGSMEAITTVDCAASGNCTDSHQGVSDVLCDAAHPANCVDPRRSPSQFGTTFNAAPAAHPYFLTIEIKLNGGERGSASIYSVGTHLIPFRHGTGPHGAAWLRKHRKQNP
jgi:hypothetical protein